MGRLSDSNLTSRLADVQSSLQQVQGLAAAPQLLLQVKEQMEMATKMAESLADDYHRAQQRLKVLEKMIKVALSLTGYSDDMIEDLQRELEDVKDGQSTNTEHEAEKEGEHPHRVGSTLSRSSGSSGEARRLEESPETPSRSSGPSRHPETDEHHLPGRPRPRVPTPDQIESLEDILRQAFETGSPKEAWEASQALVAFAREVVIEAARARFKANFGSSQCLTCDGLKVRPGVVATCAQMKQCYYSSALRDPDKLSRVAETLSELKS